MKNIILIFFVFLGQGAWFFVFAVSPEDLASNSDHTRLTTNPASLAGIREGIVQFAPSVCRPFTSVMNPLTNGIPDAEKENRLFNSKSIVELGSCLPNSGKFEPNQGAVSFDYGLIVSNNDWSYFELNDVLYAGEELYFENGNIDFYDVAVDYDLSRITAEINRNDLSLVYEKNDSISDSLQLGYSWEAISLGLGFDSLSEWNSNGRWQSPFADGEISFSGHDPFDPNTTFTDNGSFSDLYPSALQRYDEWREEDIISYSIGVYFEAALLGPVQLGYRRNLHQYKHDFYKDKNAYLNGSGFAYSNDYGLLMPRFLKYFNLAYNSRKFEQNPIMNFKIEHNSGRREFSVEFSPKEYTEVGLGTMIDFGKFDFDVNFEQAMSIKNPDFGSFAQAYKFSLPTVDMYYGEKTSTYTLYQLKESTVEVSIPFIRIGYKIYELAVRESYEGGYKSVASFAYPMVTLNAYFGSGGFLDSAPSPKKCDPDDIKCYGNSNWRVTY